MKTPLPKVHSKTDVPASEADSITVDSALLQKELAVQKDDYLRLVAEFDNFKKRTRRETEERAAAEKESFIHELLPILDNLERALACGQSSPSEQLRQGVEMTRLQLSRLLHSHGIEAAKDLGVPFDPHRHEALSLMQKPDQPDHSVIEVIQRGYSRGDKVFRPAKVVVNDHSHTNGVGCAR